MPSPELEATNAILREELAKAPSDLSWEEMRANYAMFGDLFPADPSTTATELELDGVPTTRFAGPDADESRAMLFFHGGGYCIGGIVTYHAITSRTALAFGGPVYAIDYRLAPEHAFPSPRRSRMRWPHGWCCSTWAWSPAASASRAIRRAAAW